MGLILIPSEVVQKADILKNFLINNIENYRKALQMIQTFSDSKELDTVTYNKLKSQISEYHQPIVQGMAAAEDSILEAAESLKQSVGSEELDEDLLNEAKEKLEAEQEKIKEQIKEYQLLRSRVVYASWGRPCNPINGEIARLQEELAKTQQILFVVRKKLTTLTEINNSTVSLFDDALNILLAIEAALYDAGVEIPDAEERFKDLDWRKKLSNENKNMIDKIRPFIEETLEEELQIDLDELIELYGDDVVERMIEILNENGIDRFGEGSAEKVIGAVMEGLTGYQVTKVDGKYQYVDKDGINKTLTTSKAKEFLQIQAKLEELVNIAMGEVGTAEKDHLNEVKYNNWYYFGKEDLSGTGITPPSGKDVYAWCSVFVMWCMNKTELLDGETLPELTEITGEVFEGVEYVKNWYNKEKRLYTFESGYEPKEGDLFFHFKEGDSGAGHTGIIVAYDKENKKVYTLEGNSDDKVAYNERDYDSYFYGFGSNWGNSFGTISGGYEQPSTKDR